MSMKLSVASISLLLLVSSCVTEAASFDVTKYGAKPGGDITQALTSAWKEACAATTSSIVVIPGGTFSLGQVNLDGPCKAPVDVQVAATVKAPADPSQFKNGDGWVNFNHIEQFTLSGGGTFDGQGATSWDKNDCAKTGKCGKLPINLRFSFLTNVIIQDITSKDSKLFHVNVLGCKNITFQRFKVDAPEESPNTDGIHIGRSNGVTITDSDIKTGDDCVSIGDGSQQVTVTKVTCGPGHGISVGSLGRYPDEEPVVGVTVKNCTLTNTLNGVRVKTWPASPNGEASNLHFENIIMNNVGNPVLIDQEYCPYGQCKAQIPSRVKISDVSFKNIQGTSSTQLAVKLVCSKGIPCQNVEVGDINLTYEGKEGPAISKCSNIQPKLTGKQIPATCTA